MSVAPPTKPLTAYFKFRIETINDLKAKGVDEGRAAKAKELWDDLSEKEKGKLEAEYQAEMVEWRKANDKFKEAHPNYKQKESRRSKSKEKEVKPEKAKGGKSKSKDTKEKSERKERSKSKESKAGKGKKK